MITCLLSLSVGIRTDSLSSHESGIKAKPKHNVNELDWAALEEEAHKAKKQSTQIAKELSDLINYVQVSNFVNNFRFLISLSKKFMIFVEVEIFRS